MEFSVIITIIISDKEAYWDWYERNFKWPNYLFMFFTKALEPRKNSSVVLWPLQKDQLRLS